ncbi:hypothetical protein D3C81_2284190 [compost metagenome]
MRFLFVWRPFRWFVSLRKYLRLTRIALPGNSGNNPVVLADFVESFERFNRGHFAEW